MSLERGRIWMSERSKIHWHGVFYIMRISVQSWGEGSGGEKRSMMRERMVSRKKYEKEELDG